MDMWMDGWVGGHVESVWRYQAGYLGQDGAGRDGAFWEM